MIEGLPVLFGAGLGSRIARSVVSNSPIEIGKIDNLSQSLTIAGAAYSPTAYLVADDINPTTGSWTSRHAAKSLTLSGSGTAPSYGVDSPIYNDAVKYAGAKYHLAGDTTWGQITTGDGAIEILMRMADGFLAGMCATGVTDGIRLNCASGILYLLIGDSGSFVNTAVNSAVLDGSWIHFFLGIDKSDKCYFFVNGVYTGVSASTAALGDTVGPALSVGAFNGGESPSSAALAHLGIWDLTTSPWPGSATNQATMGAIALDRFQTLTGISCTKGTAFSFARASGAYVDRYVSSGVRQLFRVSSNWPRVCERSDGSTQAYGYLSEPQCINEFLYSEDFSQAATWAPTRASVSSNAIAGPDGTTTADGIIASADSNTHFLDQSVSASAAEHIFSVWAKKGAVDWLELEAPSVSQAYAYFDLANGALGSLGSGGNCHFIQDWGNGWYRCSFCYTGGAGAHGHRIYPAEADNDSTFAGDGATVSTYVWGAQHEDDGTAMPSSYIKTTTGAATRVKDVLTRTISGMTTGRFIVEADFYGGLSYDNTAALALVSVDDASADNAIDISVTTADVANTAVAAGGAPQASITGTQNITNGLWRKVQAKMFLNSVKQLVDGTADGTEDTSATMPSGMTVLRIGCSTTSNTGQPLGLLKNVKVLRDVI